MKKSKLIVVTGGAGFIGSNLVRGLNDQGHDRILVVDEIKEVGKFSHLVGLDIYDYMDKSEFHRRLLGSHSGGVLADEISVVFHQGACSDTMERDGSFMLRNNYSYSKDLLDFCAARDVRLIYASSASVYGGGRRFREERACEHPINIYGYSKMLFDHHVRHRMKELKMQVCGLRYFNVYGPNEECKGRMASVAFHFNAQLKEFEIVKLFRGSGGYGDGEQRRDFVFVEDVVNVNLWLLQNPRVSGIFNVGTGASRSFNEMANCIMDWHGKGRIEYIDMPAGLPEAYQSFTEADLAMLRSAGYSSQFTPIEQGVRRYLDWLNGDRPA